MRRSVLTVASIEPCYCATTSSLLSMEPDPSAFHVASYVGAIAKTPEPGVAASRLKWRAFPDGRLM